MDFEGSLGKMALEIGHGLPQCMFCFFHTKSLRNHPEAKLFVLEARFEIQHLRFKQIRLGLVEVTEVCSPAYVPDDANARFSQLSRGRFDYHGSRSKSSQPFLNNRSLGSTKAFVAPVERFVRAPQIKDDHLDDF
jgi:hypothetical protein